MESRKEAICVTLIILGLFVFASCTQKAAKNSQQAKKEAAKGKEQSRGVDSSAAPADLLENTRFWAYQIQKQDHGNNMDKLADSHYDMLVIDQTRSLKGDEDYDSKKDVSLLKKSANSRGGRKLVVCYIDVGEAESYRWYWQKDWKVGNPDWIVAEDPDGWDENYPVKFWRHEWKDIMKKCIDRIIYDGYDGIYLDWLEVYSFEQVAEAAEAEGLSPIAELTKFVGELRGYARKRNPCFLIIAQNAAELGTFAGYTEFFDAIAQEAIWYDGTGDPDSSEQPGDEPWDADESQELLYQLEEWQDLDKPVFNVEYAQEQSNVDRSYRLGQDNGLITYVTLRPLDRLTATPPPGY